MYWFYIQLNFDFSYYIYFSGFLANTFSALSNLSVSILESEKPNVWQLFSSYPQAQSCCLIANSMSFGTNMNIHK